MRPFFLALFILLLGSGLQFDRGKTKLNPRATESSFDKARWRVKDGKDYPYRAQMLDSVVYNDTIRSLNKIELLELLGEPDKSNDGYLYYRISQKRAGPWPLTTRTLVIKFVDDESIEWIKIHD